MSTETQEMLLFTPLQLKRISLVLLTFQNVALILVMSYSRTQSGDMYFSSTAVVMGELLKLVTCFFFIAIEEKGIRPMFRVLHEQILQDPWDCFLISIPSLVYVLQNNLLFLAVSNLDAATFQVTYQLKILTTALFFRFLLKREVTYQQWLSLIVLFVGVALAQLGAVNTQSPKSVVDPNAIKQNPWIGLAAIIVASSLSGFAGVFFEKLLKGSNKSLWLRNIQLAGLGLPIGLITVFLKDGSKVHEHGFFFGYNYIVVIVVILQSLGGLLVAAVVKYADNILKGFATSAAIILSAFISIYLLGFNPTIFFVMGASCVCGAIVIYAQYPPKATPALPK